MSETSGPCGHTINASKGAPISRHRALNTAERYPCPVFVQRFPELLVALPPPLLSIEFHSLYYTRLIGDDAGAADIGSARLFVRRATSAWVG
jgi:hypothetical protein